ncbi:MAG: PIN domain-containing protein [Candidatus Omnitrophica bacterium]|nr:PIN domain-containing protein [Candidatus Omnitrophota bacterium]
MIANIFLDTNILVYAFGEEDEPKQARAKDAIEDVLRLGIGAVSAQVLNEFFYVITTRTRIKMGLQEARIALESICALTIVEMDRHLSFRAIDICAEHRINYWDSLILAAAERAKCRTLLTEDFTHNRKYGLVKAINPFA